MKSFTDLLDFPFVFTQRELLSEKKFLEAYKKRVLYLELKISKETLRSLHQKNIWLPVCGQFKLESGERKYFDLRFIDSLRKTVGIEYLYSPYQLLLIPFIRRFLITKKEDAEIELLKK